MSSAETYQTLIQKLDWDGLLKLYQNRSEVPWELGKALEYIVVRAFEIEGANVRYPFEVRVAGEIVEQLDGVIHTDFGSILLETKDQVANVNIEPIAKLRNQLLRRSSNAIGLVISHSSFTDPAMLLVNFIAPQAILLMVGGELEWALKNKSFLKHIRKKYQHCIETGESLYDIRGGA